MAGKAGAIRAGKAFVELFAEKSKLTKGLADAGREFKAWGASVAGIGKRVMGVGAGIVAPLVGFAAVAGNVGGELIDTAAKTGLSVEALSTLGHAAATTGVDVATLSGSVGKMQKTLVAAAKGSKGAKAALAGVGLTAEQLAGLNPEQQFKAIADGLAKITDPAARSAAAMAIFGKSGAALLPMLAGGAAGLNEAQAAARALGLEISTADAVASDQFGDTLDGLKAQATAFAVKVGAALLPLLQQAATWFATTGSAVVRFVEQNRGLVGVVFAVGAGLVAVGGAITAAGYALSGFGSVLGLASRLLPLVGSALSALAPVALALLSPLGAVAAAVAGVGAYFVYSSGAIGDAVDWLGGVFSQLAGDASTAFSGIKAALAAGDWGTAAAVGLAFLKLEFARALGFLSAKWEEFSAFVFNLGADVWASTATAMSDAYAGFESFLASSFPAIYEIWTQFTTWLSNTWAKVMGWLAQKYGEAVQAITGEDQSAVIAQIGADTQAAVDANNAEAQRRLGLDQQGRLSDIEARRAARSQQFADENAAARGRNNNARDNAIRGLENEVKAAEGELAKAVAKGIAGEAGAAAERKQLNAFDPKAGGFDPATAAAGLSAGVKAAGPKTAGTFSGALAAQQLGGRGVDEKIAENTKATTEHLKRLISVVEQGGAAFA